MADQTPTPAPVPTADPAPKYPRLRKLAELAFTIGLAYLGAKFGIPIPTAEVTAEAPAIVAVDARYLVADKNTAEDVAPTISGKTEYPAHALVRLRADGVKPGAAVMWRVSPRSDVQRATTKGDLLEFAAPPGVYDVELLVLTQVDGALSVQEVFAKVTIAGAPKVDPKPQPDPKKDGTLDPVAALGRIQFGNSGCTATAIGPRRADGRWDILTASHCMPGVGSRGTMKLKDGRSLSIRVVVHQKQPDLAWCITEDVIADMPYANIAAKNPEPGVKMWHMGYGVDKPGNREDGEVTESENRDGQTQFFLNVSSGDSGGGFFRADTNEVISTACCTSSLAQKARVWGASVDSIRKARPGVVRLHELQEPPAIDTAPEPRCCH